MNTEKSIGVQARLRQALGLVNAEMDGRFEEFKGIMKKSMR